MKKGNIGLVFGMVGKKLKSSLGGSVDFGLTGKDGVVHPSLAVRILKDTFSAGFRYICCIFKSSRVLLFYFFCLQESAKKFEQNVSLVGSTVESLLYRYGKVTFEWFYIGKTTVRSSCFNLFELSWNFSSTSDSMSCFLMTTAISSYLPISVSEVLFVCNTAAVFPFSSVTVLL